MGACVGAKMGSTIMLVLRDCPWLRNKRLELNEDYTNELPLSFLFVFVSCLEDKMQGRDYVMFHY